MLDEDDDIAEPIHGVFRDLATVTPQPPTWIVEGLVCPGLQFVAGPPKCGKSTLADAVAALVAGYPCTVLPPFLSVVREQGTVLIFSAEATAEALKYEMETGMGLKLREDEHLLVADDPFSFRLDDPDGLGQLMFWLRERAPKLVILDPLADLHQAEEKDARAMIGVLRPLRQWGIENGSCVLCIHHTKKPGEGQTTYDALDMRGSGAIYGKADGCLMMTPRGRDVHVRAVFKRAAPWEKTIRLAVWGQEGGEKLDDVDLLVLRAIAAGSSMDIASKMVGVSKTTIFERIRKLEANRLVGKGPAGAVVVTDAGRRRMET
jgi:hypothetical protein